MFCKAFFCKIENICKFVPYDYENNTCQFLHIELFVLQSSYILTNILCLYKFLKFCTNGNFYIIEFLKNYSIEF